MEHSNGTFKTIVLLPALGAVAAQVFHIWAGWRHFSPLLTVGLAASIASSVAWILGVLDLKAVAGWTATTFIVWWAIMNPADVGHVAANVAVFMSNARTGAGNLIASV